MIKNLFCLFAASFMLSENTEELIYNSLAPSQILISEEKIYVMENEKLLQVKGVFSMGDSLYYAKFPSGDKPWMCPNCDYINDKNAVTCDGCNWDPRIDPIPFR